MASYNCAGFGMDSTTVSPDGVAEQLERMLQSGVFRGATRSSTVLRYLVEETLGGRADRLKDYSIGADALGRGESFDPRTDPIARVEASRLRSRLELYYATEGASDPILISLPKGGYVPTFETRPLAAASPVVAAPPLARARTPPAVWAAIGVAALAGIGVLVWWMARGPTVVAREMRLEISTPATTDPLSLALSPDGQQIVFVASAGEHARLWLRPLDSTTSRPLAGTEHAALPFWSPDSRSLGFFAGDDLKRIDLDTGLVKSIGRAIVAAGGTWNRENVVLYPLVPDSPIYRTTAAGGSLQAVTALAAPRATGHRAPQFLPDERHFLFYVMGSADVRGVHVGELGSEASRRLLDADTPAVLGPAHLFYLVGGTLFAQGFDANRQSLVGKAQAVAERVAFGGGAGVAALSVSAAGPIAYRTGSSGGRRQFVWVDRSGRELSRLGAPGSFGSPGYASMSPDGRRLAVQRVVDGDANIWLLDLDRETPVLFTTVSQADIAPLWSPLGDRIVFSSLRNGRPFDLYEQPVAGGEARRLLQTNLPKQATDWSRDGRYLLVRNIAPDGTDTDISALDLEGDRTPFDLVRTRFEERDAKFSPDGEWIAYQSNDSGRFEIYVQPFRAAGPRKRVSTNGGTAAQWRADGRELFYLAPDSRLLAVPVAPSDDGALNVGAATALFTARVGSVEGGFLNPVIPSSDGQRFLVDAVVEEQVPPIVVILNWKPR
jgi:Tol biopolymer transport system component